jgi:hypothetical protein
MLTKIMKNKIFIIISILIIVIGTWIAKANNIIHFSIGNKITPLSSKKIDDKKIIKSKIHSSTKLMEDEDGYTNYIFADNIKLYTNGGVLRITDMTPTSVKTAFGNPISETTEFSDVEYSNILIYKYANGNISFLNDKLLTVEGLDEGFSFEFTKVDGTNFPVAVGSYSSGIYENFTTSYENGSNITSTTGNSGNVTVFLKSRNGQKTDANIIFGLYSDINSDIGNNTVTSITVQN